MAKKTKKVEVKEPQLEKTVTEFFEETVTQEAKVETLVMETPEPRKEKWEIKDRVYYLRSKRKPLSYSIKASGIYWFDEEKGYERELKYTSNQKTCFVDEMKGDQLLEHIIFRSGTLFVPKNKTVLQKFLSLYHPHTNGLFYEYKPEAMAKNELVDINLEVDALIAARNMDFDIAEAVMRVEIGSKVSEMSSKELKRDLLVFARRNPKLFLDLVRDENVVL